MMDIRSRLACLCILVLTVLVPGCMESGPYDNFTGLWVLSPEGRGNTGDRGALGCFSLDPERRLLTVRLASGDERLLFELPVTGMEARDGSLALTINGNAPEWSGGLPHFRSLIFEPLDEGAMLAKFYGNEIAPQKLLDAGAPAPNSIEEVRRPDSAQKELLAGIVSSSEKLFADWYLDGDDEKPALQYDAQAHRLKLRNARLVKTWGDSTLIPVGYVEVEKDDSRTCGLFVRNGSGGEGYLMVRLDQSPPEGRLKLAGKEFVLLPELSASEKRQRAEAKQEARRQAAREALEAKRKSEEEARLAREKAEAEKQRLKEEAEARKRELAEKRATMPEFSFNDIRLSDTPQKMVEKGLANYRMATSFPVQQKGNSIVNVKNPSLGSLSFLLEDPLLTEFFQGRPMQRLNVGSRYWQLGSETTQGYSMGPGKTALGGGLRPDQLIFEDKTRNDPLSTRMVISFFTLPNGSPRPLLLEVNGDIVLDALPVFRERYGEPESVKGTESDHSRQYIWRSDKEIAILRADRQNDGYYQHHQLYIVSLPAYEELMAFTNRLERQEEDAKKAAEEARLAREKAVQDARKAGI